MPEPIKIDMNTTPKETLKQISDPVSVDKQVTEIPVKTGRGRKKRNKKPLAQNSALEDLGHSELSVSTKPVSTKPDISVVVADPDNAATVKKNKRQKGRRNGVKNQTDKPEKEDEKGPAKLTESNLPESNLPTSDGAPLLAPGEKKKRSYYARKKARNKAIKEAIKAANAPNMENEKPAGSSLALEKVNEISLEGGEVIQKEELPKEGKVLSTTGKAKKRKSKKWANLKNAQNVSSKELSDQKLTQEAKALNGTESKVEIAIPKPVKKVYPNENPKYFGKKFNPGHKKPYKIGTGVSEDKTQLSIPDTIGSKTEVTDPNPAVLASEGLSPQERPKLSNDSGNSKTKDSFKQQNRVTNSQSKKSVSPKDNSNRIRLNSVSPNNASNPASENPKLSAMPRVKNTHISTKRTGDNTSSIVPCNSSTGSIEESDSDDFDIAEIPKDLGNCEYRELESPKVLTDNGDFNRAVLKNAEPVDFEQVDSEHIEGTHMDILEANHGDLEAADILADFSADRGKPNHEEIYTSENHTNFSLEAPEAAEALKLHSKSGVSKYPSIFSCHKATDQRDFKSPVDIESSGYNKPEAFEYAGAKATRLTDCGNSETTEVPADLNQEYSATTKILTDCNCGDTEFAEISETFEEEFKDNAVFQEGGDGTKIRATFNQERTEITEIRVHIQGTNQDEPAATEIPVDSNPDGSENAEIFGDYTETNQRNINSPRVLAGCDHADAKVLSETCPNLKKSKHDGCSSNFVETPTDPQELGTRGAETTGISTDFSQKDADPEGRKHDNSKTAEVPVDSKESHSNYIQTSSTSEALGSTKIDQKESDSTEVASTHHRDDSKGANISANMQPSDYNPYSTKAVSISEPASFGLWKSFPDFPSTNLHMNLDDEHDSMETPDTEDYYSSVSEDSSTSYEEDQSESSFGEAPGDEVSENYECDKDEDLNIEDHPSPHSIVARSATKIAGLSRKRDFDFSHEPPYERVLDILCIIFPKMMLHECKAILIEYFDWLKVDGRTQLPTNDEEIAKQLVYWTAHYALGGAKVINEKGIPEEDIEKIGKETELFRQFGQVNIFTPRIVTPEERVEVLLILNRIFPSMSNETAQIVAEGYFKRHPKMFYPDTPIEERVYDTALTCARILDSFRFVRQEFIDMVGGWKEALRAYKTHENINNFAEWISWKLAHCSPIWLSWDYIGNANSTEHIVIHTMRSMYTSLPIIVEQQVLVRVFSLCERQEILDNLIDKIRFEVWFKACGSYHLIEIAKETLMDRYPTMSPEEVIDQAREYVYDHGHETYDGWGPVADAVFPLANVPYQHKLLLEISKMYPCMSLESKACLAAKLGNDFTNLKKRLRHHAIVAATPRNAYDTARAEITANNSYKGLSQNAIKALIKKAVERITENSEEYQRWLGTWKEKVDKPKDKEEEEEGRKTPKKVWKGKFKMNPTAPVFRPARHNS